MSTSELKKREGGRRRIAVPLPPDKRMANHTNVDLSVLYDAGKSYNWERPSCRKNCGKVWGHGYVQRYFAGYMECFWLKRYRCPACREVITMHPLGFFKKYQSSIKQIFEALRHKLAYLRWPKGTSRQRGGHWLRKFTTKLKMDFMGPSPPTPVVLLERLYKKMINFLS